MLLLLPFFYTLLDLGLRYKLSFKKPILIFRTVSALVESRDEYNDI